MEVPAALEGRVEATDDGLEIMGSTDSDAMISFGLLGLLAVVGLGIGFEVLSIDAQHLTIGTRELPIDRVHRAYVRYARLDKLTYGTLYVWTDRGEVEIGTRRFGWLEQRAICASLNSFPAAIESFLSHARRLEGSHDDVPEALRGLRARPALATGGKN